MNRDAASLAGKEYDLLVIGGGVYGAFAAWDAVLRGLKVALVEKGDFAAGTSANSLKIAHGGLRYLQNADIARTRESAREQGIFLSIAPHLVHPLRCLIPTEGYLTRSRCAMACAFGIYGAVKPRGYVPANDGAGFPPCRIVSRKECRTILGSAAMPSVTGGAVWGEGLIYNTERFVISILRSAASNGLDVANYIEAKRFLLRDRRVFGIEALDRLNGDHFEIRARCTLNATGPWARHMARRLTGNLREETPSLVKAIDLIVGRTLFDGYAVGLRSWPAGAGRPSMDGSRLYFFVPWRGTTMIGTHYTPHRGGPDAAAVEEREIEEFLGGIQAVLPERSIAAKDIRALHFGLLPMDPASDRRGAPSPASKPWFCDHARSDGMEGIVSVQGVKYTTARAVAERTVDCIAKKLGVPGKTCRTGMTPIFGGDGSSSDPSGIFPETVLQHLARNYGSESSRILGYAAQRPELARTVAGSQEVLRAELLHGIREEMAQSLGDLVFRRTDLGTAGHPGRECLEECARLAAVELGWDDQRISRELESVERSYPDTAALPARKAGPARVSGA
ncbi:MAG: glycerol-3-phosphate dehydrogenase [Deltaproteobacteria bacterium]|nr:glycerol-3-phosphate dehydrogenase [Deltaproteobacteria bacterium]